jgi:hypothetical protein
MVSYTDDNFLGPASIAVGDFNNDNYTDIAVANYDNKSVGILLGIGNGTFLPEKITFTGNNTDPNEIAVADFNNDNHLDVVITN